MKYIAKVIFELVILVLIMGVAVWYLVTEVLPAYMK